MLKLVVPVVTIQLQRVAPRSSPPKKQVVDLYLGKKTVLLGIALCWTVLPSSVYLEEHRFVEDFFLFHCQKI